MSWWTIFTTWDFWLGYIIGFLLATLVTGILDRINNPYGGTILHSFGDVDLVAQRVEKALSELTKWLDKEVSAPLPLIWPRPPTSPISGLRRRAYAPMLGASVLRLPRGWLLVGRQPH